MPTITNTHTGTNSPEGVQPAVPGDIYIQNNPLAPQEAMWVKAAGTNATGWIQQAGNIEIRADGTNETGKFTNKTGQMDLKGRRMVINGLPNFNYTLPPNQNVKARNGYYKILKYEGDRNACIPVDEQTLRSTISPLVLGGAYNAWSEDMMHTFNGERYVFVHYNHGGHKGAATIVCMRTAGENVWTQREELWGPSELAPAGYVSACAGVLNGCQFILVSPNTEGGEPDWRLYRRRLAEQFDLTNAITAVNVSGTWRTSFRKALFNFPAYRGMKFSFSAIPTSVGGATFDANEYVVTDITNSYVYFQSVAAPSAPIVAQDGGGGQMRVIVNETPFIEVKFTGNTTFGAAYKAVSGNTVQPTYPNSFTCDTRGPGNNGKIFINANYGSAPMIIACDGVLRYEGLSTVATMTVSPAYSNVPNILAQGTIQWVDDNSAAGIIIGTLQTRGPTSGPGLFWTSAALNTVPTTIKRWTQGTGMNSNMPVVVTNDYGNGRKIICSMTSNRDTNKAQGESWAPLEHWLIVGDLDQFVDPNQSQTPINNIFEWYRWGSIGTYDHNATADLNSGPAAGGVGSMVLMPSGGAVSITTATAAPNATFGKAIANHYVAKVDITQFTGEVKVPNMSPDFVQFLNHAHLQFTGTEADTVTGQYFRPLKREWDYTNGDYDEATGLLTTRISGDYEITATVDVKCDNTEFYMQLWDYDKNIAYINPYNDYNGAKKICRTKAPIHSIVTAQQTVRAYILGGQTVGLRVMSGTALRSPDVSEIAIRRVA